MMFEIRSDVTGDVTCVDNVRLGPPAAQGFAYYTGSPTSPGVGLYGIWADGSVVDLRLPVTLPTNEWVHVAVTYDGVVVQQYLNGIPQSAIPAPGKALAISKRLWIGKGFNVRDDVPAYFNGVLDEICLLHRALAPFEIQSLYRSGPSGICKRDDPPMGPGGPFINISYDGSQIWMDWPASFDAFTVMTSPRVTADKASYGASQARQHSFACRDYLSVSPTNFATGTNFFLLKRP